LLIRPGDNRDAKKIQSKQRGRVAFDPEIAEQIDYFPVDFPSSGNFLETIPAQTASTAIQSAD
jgi:hypothetical protein